MTTFLDRILTIIGLDSDAANKFGPTMFLGLLTIGRIVGGMVVTVMTPRNFFRLSALLGVIGTGLLATGQKQLAIVGVIAAGLGFANIWPMLFSITVEEKPERASELSGLMCMAISGGAIVPLVMGQMVDMKLGALSFVVPAACFAYLLLISLKGGKKAVTA